jgi:hypothetical protein
MGEGQPAAGAPSEPPHVVTRRMRLASPRAAMVLGALAVVLTALNVVLAELVHQLTFLGIGPGVPVFLIYAAVGVVIARHQPRNPVAWVLIGFVLLAMVSADAGYYAVYCFRLGHHGLPLAGAAAALVPLFLPGIALFPLVILLFPDGRLTSPRWRWVLVAYAGLAAWVTVATLVPTIAAIAGHHVRLDSTGDVITGGRAASDAAQGVVVIAIAAIWLAFVAHQVLSWRRASGERRQQLKWLACGGAITLVTFVSAIDQQWGVWGAGPQNHPGNKDGWEQDPAPPTASGSPTPSDSLTPSAVHPRHHVQPRKLRRKRQHGLQIRHQQTHPDRRHAFPGPAHRRPTPPAHLRPLTCAGSGSRPDSRAPMQPAERAIRLIQCQEVRP